MKKNYLKNLIIVTLFFVTTYTTYAQKPWDHGNLIVDGHMVKHSDGTGFFWMGDTIWEMFQRLNRNEVNTYLSNRSDKKYTVIQAMIMSGVGGGITNKNQHGDTPFIGTDVTKPNITNGNNPANDTEYDYWDHVDYVINKAAEEGMYIALFPTSTTFVLSQDVMNPTNARIYGKWLGNRYKNMPNIIWVLGGDNDGDNNNDGTALWDALAEGIKSEDSNHLMSFHPQTISSSTWFHNSSWLDFNMIQSGHGSVDPATYDLITKDYNLTPTKPIMDAEPRYEDIPVNLYENRRYQAFDTREVAYWHIFAGAFGHTYGHNSIWQVYKNGYTPVYSASKTWEEALDAPGGSQMQYVSELMQSRPILGRIPDKSLIYFGSGSFAKHIQATRGDGYAFLYLPSGNTVTVNMGKISGSNVKAWWYNPRDGKATEIGVFSNSGTKEFNPSGNIERGNDWVLVLDDASKGYGEPGVIAPPTSITTYTLPDDSWHMISLPANPGSKNKVSDIFADDLPGVIGTDWGVFSFNTKTEKYTSLSLNSTLKQGIGYWIIQKSGSSKVLDMPAGSTPLTATSFSVQLVSRNNEVGWNMIGNPYTSTISMSAIKVHTSNGACTDDCTLDSASSNNIVSNEFWNYSGASYVKYSGNSTLSPWVGFWVATLGQADGKNPEIKFFKANSKLAIVKGVLASKSTNTVSKGFSFPVFPVVNNNTSEINALSAIVHPNPSSGFFNFNFSSAYNGEVSIKIYSIDGRQVENLQLQKSNEIFTYQINLANKASGLYIINFEAGDYQSNHKVIKN